MTDSHDQQPPVRRVGAKDRKTRLASSAPLIPPDDPAADLSAASASVPISPDGSVDDADAVFRRPQDAAADTPAFPLPPLDVAAKTRRVQPPEKAAKSGDPNTRFQRPAKQKSVPASAAKPPTPPEKPAPYVATMPTVLEERFPPIDFHVDPPDLDAPPQPQPPVSAAAAVPSQKARRARAYNRVSLLFLALTFGVLFYYAILWVDPYSLLNPLPPFANVVVITATPQPAGGITILPTPDGQPALTPQPLESATPSPYPFKLVDQGVIYIPNPNGEACNWASIAGTVTGVDGLGLVGYAVQISNSGLNDRVFSDTAATYGAGGFELVLGGAPQAGTYQVQLFTSAGVPVSDVYAVTTLAECERNVALVNFVQTRAF